MCSLRGPLGPLWHRCVTVLGACPSSRPTTVLIRVIIFLVSDVFLEKRQLLPDRSSCCYAAPVSSSTCYALHNCQQASYQPATNESTAQQM